MTQLVQQAETAGDLGLSGMLSNKKDFIGKTSALRVGLQDPMREQLVGIRPVGAVKQLLGGSTLYSLGDEPVRGNMQGHTTSVCYSPTLEGMIGLALLKGGQARFGEQIRSVDLLRNVETLCEIVSPQFFDPTGGRVRG